MKIALDIDDTYLLSPEDWDSFIYLFREFGHDIRFVTHRHPELDEIDLGVNVRIYYTNGVAKRWWLEHNTDWKPDVWIDDKPEGILNNSDKSPEWLANWRATREG